MLIEIYLNLLCNSWGEKREAQREYSCCCDLPKCLISSVHCPTYKVYFPVLNFLLHVSVQNDTAPKRTGRELAFISSTLIEVLLCLFLLVPLVLVCVKLYSQLYDVISVYVQGCC